MKKLKVEVEENLLLRTEFNRLFKDFLTPANRKHKENKPPFIFVPNDKSYVEIAGQRIDGVDDFESFLEYLNQRITFERDYEYLYNERSRLIDHLKIKLEESKLMATYENGVRYPSIQEKIYSDLLYFILNDENYIKKSE